MRKYGSPGKNFDICSISIEMYYVKKNLCNRGNFLEGNLSLRFSLLMYHYSSEIRAHCQISLIGSQCLYDFSEKTNYLFIALNEFFEIKKNLKVEILVFVVFHQGSITQMLNSVLHIHVLKINRNFII